MIIAITNQKGGVGKTTTCINLAAAAAEKGQKVLICDADPQCNASLGLGLNEENYAGSDLYALLLGAVTLEQAIKESGRKNIDIIPATVDLAAAEKELRSIEGFPFILKHVLEEAKDNYDIIMIDCPPSLGNITINALFATDAVIIPVQAEYFALAGVKQLMTSIAMVNQSREQKVALLGTLVTMHDTRNSLSKNVTDDVKSFFGELCFKTEIPRNVRLAEAPGFGSTIIEYDKKSKGGRAYIKAAKEMLQRIENFDEIYQQSQSFFERISPFIFRE